MKQVLNQTCTALVSSPTQRPSETATVFCIRGILGARVLQPEKTSSLCLRGRPPEILGLEGPVLGETPTPCLLLNEQLLLGATPGAQNHRILSRDSAHCAVFASSSMLR